MAEHDTAAQMYLDDMVSRRGYVLDYHKVMAANDFPVLRAADNLVDAAYLSGRELDRGTKELLFILSLTVMRSEKAHIQSHIRVALELGISPQAILEAIEIALPEAGVVVFQHGFDAWREAVDAPSLEPTETPGSDGDPRATVTPKFS
ncbi:carboxymuconolactone decarboxylase family protein [Flexivirga caeni]|uniref:Carboxymuconolactone decarboxylase family protein n=1 Tax=Flexivirga caeni TaxID=2294115 RepID=A0A3M9MCL2_9MICO|nr:carboxymuconolactone decarboxylase family protein [Flexivirga caeni]RNI22935.1 carboxymuconolactone decarboxylase family protein [Flexivirga caeni]